MTILYGGFFFYGVHGCSACLNGSALGQIILNGGTHSFKNHMTTMKFRFICLYRKKLIDLMIKGILFKLVILEISMD